MSIVIDPPSLDLLTRIIDGYKLLDVQTLVSQPTVQRHYVPVFSRFSGMGEVELHASPQGPVLECFGGELCAMVHRDGSWRTHSLDGPVQGRDHVAAAERKPRLKQRSLTTKLIDQG